MRSPNCSSRTNPQNLRQSKISQEAATKSDFDAVKQLELLQNALKNEKFAKAIIDAIKPASTGEETDSVDAQLKQKDEIEGQIQKIDENLKNKELSEEDKKKLEEEKAQLIEKEKAIVAKATEKVNSQVDMLKTLLAGGDEALTAD